MGLALSVVVGLVLGSGAVALAVGLAALRHRPDPMAWPLAALMFAVTAWTIPHAISLASTDPAQAIFWHRLRYPGVAVAPVAYLIVALRYAGYERWLSNRTYAALFALPVVTTVIVWTDPLHGLHWQSLSVMRIGGASILAERFGPWRPVSLGYLYAVTAAGLLVYGGVILRSDPIYRTQALTMFLGGVVPLAANVAETLGLTPGPGIDFTGVSLSVTGLTFGLALFYFDLLDIQPIARDRLIDELDDGVVVIGPDERIRDFNPAARRILGDIAVDQPADEVLSSESASDGGELVVGTEAGQRRYRSRSTTLTDERGRRIGRILYFSDVTDLVEREQRISVLNRVLRHNIRNELNAATGYLEMVENEGPKCDEEYVAMAKEKIHEVTGFAEKARYVERTLDRDGSTVSVSATEAVDRVVADARARYDEAVIERDPVDADGEANALVVDPELFEMAIAELIENAVVHNDREPPTATVGVECEAARVRVVVADDGPGIPEHERDVLSSGTETHLEHGDGLGLWLVNWVTSLSAGTLSFEENEPRGTVVVVSLPAADR